MNCNECGAYYPKTGSLAVRDPRRVGGLSKLYSSDILRNMYSQCQAKPQRKEIQVKISPQYGEVRSLIIDWLCEVTENLHLSQRALYHAISIMDAFLTQ